MENQPTPQPTPQPDPQPAPQGCQRGCITAFVIFFVVLIILWVIGNNEMHRDEYRGQSPIMGGDRDYRRTSPGYEANAPLLPRDKDDVEPLYNEVQRRKKEQGISDKEAVKQIIEEQERARSKN